MTCSGCSNALTKILERIKKNNASLEYEVSLEKKTVMVKGVDEEVLKLVHEKFTKWATNANKTLEKISKESSSEEADKTAKADAPAKDTTAKTDASSKNEAGVAE